MMAWKSQCDGITDLSSGYIKYQAKYTHSERSREYIVDRCKPKKQLRGETRKVRWMIRRLVTKCDDPQSVQKATGHAPHGGMESATPWDTKTGLLMWANGIKMGAIKREIVDPLVLVSLETTKNRIVLNVPGGDAQ